MLAQDVTIGMTLSGALTPAGMGCSSIVPLIKAGFVDWIVATGANLYHDLHFALNYPVRAGSFTFDDTELRENDIVRVYDVTDPGDATVRMFFRDDKVYFGFDVRDQWVQYVPLFTRYDGVSVNINDRGAVYRDHNLEARWLTYIVGATGQGVALDYLPYLRDTALAAQGAMTMKGGTVPDTIGFEPDSGYTIEMAIHLTKLGYPADLGDRALFFGVNLMDGDSFGASSDLSYGTHQWWFWHDQRGCCPTWAHLDPTLQIPTGVPDAAGPDRLALLGNFPNPFRSLTTIRYALATASDVSLEVFDTQGRLVVRRGLGLQPPGTHQATFSNPGLRAGIYLYRLRAGDVLSGAARASLTGKMLLVK